MRSTRHKRRQRFSVGFICILMMWMLAGQMQVWAKEENESRTESLDEKALQEILGQLDFQETNEQLKELFPEERLDFKETVTELISGDTKATASLLNRMVRDQVFYAFRSARKNLIQIILLALIAAVLNQFSSVFQNRQIAEISFYAMYALPDSGYKKYIRFFTGLILVLLLASPVLQLFQTDVDRWMNDPEENYREWTEKMEDIQEEFTGTGISEDPMRDGIAEVEEIKIGR